MNFVESHERLFLKFSKGRLPLLLLGTPAFSKLAQKCHCAFCTKFFAPKNRKIPKKKIRGVSSKFGNFPKKRENPRVFFALKRLLKMCSSRKSEFLQSMHRHTLCKIPMCFINLF